MSFELRFTRRGFMASGVVAGASLLARRSEARRRPTELPRRASTAVAPVDPKSAVELATRHLIESGLDDIFPRPFELDELGTRRNECLRAQQRVLEILAAGPRSIARLERPLYAAVPKTRGAELRSCAWFHPESAIAYLALALLAAPRIEAARAPIGQRRNFSYRFAPGRESDASLFDRRFDARAFRYETLRQIRAGAASTVAYADVRHFYDSVEHERLGRRLHTLGVKPDVVDLLVATLRHLGPESGRGLPTGSNASRILGEAMLIPVDDALSANGVAFTRFVDDFRLFADGPVEAHDSLQQLAALLSNQGFELHRGKSRVRTFQAPEVEEEEAPESPKPSPPRRRPRRRRPSGGHPQPKPASPSEEEPEIIDPTRGELIRLRRIDLAGEWQLLEEDPDPPAWRLRRFVRAAAYRPAEEYVRQLPGLALRWPFAARTIVSTLVAASAGFSGRTRREIRTAASRVLTDPRPPIPYVSSQFVRLLSAPAYVDRAAIRHLCGRALAEKNDLLARAALDASFVAGLRSVANRDVRSWPGHWSRRAADRLVDSATQPI